MRGADSAHGLVYRRAGIWAKGALALQHPTHPVAAARSGNRHSSCLAVSLDGCAIAANQRDAIAHGWERVAPGDRLLVIVDEVDAAIAQIHGVRAAGVQDAACVTPIARERARGA